MMIASLRRKYTHNVLAALLAAGMLLPVATPAQGFLKASGHIIVDGSGHKYILRGMGLGGWGANVGLGSGGGVIGRGAWVMTTGGGRMGGGAPGVSPSNKRRSSSSQLTGPDCGRGVEAGRC